MSESIVTSRPARKRTVIGTYNLKMLSDTARHTRKSYSKRERATTYVQTDNRHEAAMHTDTTSSLTASITAPIQSASGAPCRNSSAVLPEVLEAGMQWSVNSIPADISISQTNSSQMKVGCFNKLAQTRGHYYSAHALHAHGVWIGYLAPDRQKERFLELPSFFDLKRNFSNMRLPFPPLNLRTSASNCEAVCRGCFSDQSLTLTVRELPYANNKVRLSEFCGRRIDRAQNLVIMPLDGDDDVGMFCILIPQSLDRSMKHLQAWRLYEMGNGCDGKSFDNKFELLTLRYPDRETGFIEIVSRNLGPNESAQTNTRRDVPERIATTPASEILPTTEIEERVDGRHVSRTGSTTQHLEGRNDSVATHNTHKRKRSDALHGEPLSATPATLPHSTDAVFPGPLRHVSPRPEHTLDHLQHLNPEENVATIPNAPVTTEPTTFTVSHENSHNIHIVWTLDVDGSTYDLCVTMAECESFKRMMEKLREVATFIPPALAMLEKTKMWQMSYGLPNGRNKVHIARRDTEVAFDRMRTELAQYVLGFGKTVEVKLRPMG